MNKTTIAVFVAIAVVGISVLATHPSNQTSVNSLNSIQTDQTTLFYAKSASPNCARFVEQVLPSESKAATENLKAAIAAL